MDAAARQHRREQLREAQRRSRQRRQETLERLTEQNRQLTAELHRVRQSVKDVVDLAWERWTTGDISNELLERLVALNNSFSLSGASSAGEPLETAYSQTPESISRSEGASMPFTMNPDFSLFQDERLSYALEPSEFTTFDESSTVQSPQVAQSEQRSDDPPEGTVSLADIENKPDDQRMTFCVPVIDYDCGPSCLARVPWDIKSALSPEWLLLEELCLA